MPLLQPRVPNSVLFLLIFGCCLQVIWHGMRPTQQANAESLPSAPSVAVLRLVSLGDPLLTARALMLWLQAFDNQPGMSIPFAALDYDKVRAWLARILALDPRGQYPLIAASRLYAQVPVEDKQRAMLAFVYEQFFSDPNRRWPWLVHGVILARHSLKDVPLALKYAQAITSHATGPHVPYWARDMSIIILEDMGELEKARALIGKLLKRGDITDPGEVLFLKKKLEEIGRRIGSR
ncbi:MAG: hypothetical protein KJO08_06475 [Gammaproteobacteria bacterium]|nr:hypothetical protein [Gammaproteobacteria bacterium]